MLNPDTGDAGLVERARAGDVDAYAELVRRYQDQALSTAYVVLHDHAEAEDVAQEAFTNAFQALHRFRPDGSFRAWLLKIVLNEAHDFLTARRRRQDVLARVAPMETTTRSQSAEAAALSHGRREALLEALFDLPEADRLVIICRYFLDLSELETAEVLGVARGTVKSRLSRALRRLGPVLRDLGPLVLVGPGLEKLAEKALPELGRGLLVHPGADVSQAVLGRISAGALPGSVPSGLRNRATQLTMVGTAVAALLAGAVVLAGGARSNPVAAVPANPTASVAISSRPESVIVYGGDITDADRQELVTEFGSSAATIETVSRQELIEGLRARGLAVAPADEAISSVRLVCSVTGSGLDIETHNINGIPAPGYAAALLIAGLNDAAVMIAAPTKKPVTGETALVGMFKAIPACFPSKQTDAHRVQLAYEQLKATVSLAGDTSDLAHASAALGQVLHAVITSHAQDDTSVKSALELAAAQEGLTINDSTESTLVNLFQTLRILDYGPYTRGYRIEELGPDHVRVVASEGT